MYVGRMGAYVYFKTLTIVIVISNLSDDRSKASSETIPPNQAPYVSNHVHPLGAQHHVRSCSLQIVTV